jgi:hypothetical protein
MRHKLRLLNLVLIAVFIFSFTGCVTYKLSDSATDKTAAETTATAAAETTTPETTTQPVQENVDYNIGDTGPAGGFIFYVNPNYESDGWRYLEAAASDLPGEFNNYYILWDYRDYGNNPVTGATATAIGTGKANTQKIVDIQGNGSYAARLCSDLTQGGCSDWFLPSKDEVILMYKNLYLKGIGSFEPGFYWSSSEYDAYSAWYQYFDNGVQGSNYKANFIRVRAVRAF